MEKIIKNVINHKTSNTHTYRFTRDNRNFFFIGEVHSGLKDDISRFLDTKEKILTIIECNEGINKIPIKITKKHYKQRLKINKIKKDESYIDNHIFYFSNKYKTIKNILNWDKSLKEISNGKNVKVHCIDKRDPKDFESMQSSSLYRKDKIKFNRIKKIFTQLKTKIERLENSSIKRKLLIEINNILDKKLTPTSAYLMTTISEIILDFEILKRVLKGKDNIVVGIFGNNHIKNIKNYLN